MGISFIDWKDNYSNDLSEEEVKIAFDAWTASANNCVSLILQLKNKSPEWHERFLELYDTAYNTE